MNKVNVNSLGLALVIVTAVAFTSCKKSGGSGPGGTSNWCVSSRTGTGTI